MGTTGGMVLRVHLGLPPAGNRFTPPAARPSRHAERAGIRIVSQARVPGEGTKVPPFAPPGWPVRSTPKPAESLGWHTTVCPQRGCAFLFGEGSPAGPSRPVPSLTSSHVIQHSGQSWARLSTSAAIFFGDPLPVVRMDQGLLRSKRRVKRTNSCPDASSGVLRSRSRCPRVASRFEYTVVGVPVMGGESSTARIQSTIGLEPDA